MEDRYILALDIGTSSVRAGLYTMAGDVLPETMVKNERFLSATDDGGAEIDGDKAFEQICEAVDDVLNKCGSVKGDIAYVATSSFWHSLVGIGKNGVPTTKVFGWADTRSGKAVVRLRKNFTESEIHNVTGARFHSSFWPAKLLWIKAEYPAAFKETAYWGSLTDLVWQRLFGRIETSISMASASGIFDNVNCAWHDDLRKFTGVRKNQLPRVAADGSTNVISAEYAKRWPRLANAEWFGPVGDGAANNIGAGCVGRGKAAIMVGTSGAMRVAFRGKIPERMPRGLWCYRIDRKRIVIGGALSDGGGLYRWLKDNFRLHSEDDITEDEIEKRPPAEHGIVFLPFVAGERSTGYHENASGAILGLRSAHDHIDIVQAALESVAYRFAEIFDQLKRVCKIDEIIASGGALRESPVWTQIITDVLGRKMSLPAVREASSRGAVLLALETIGKIDKLEKLGTSEGKPFTPNNANRSAYKEGREKHAEAYRLLVK